MYCIGCSKKLNNGEIVCSNCGTNQTQVNIPRKPMMQSLKKAIMKNKFPIFIVLTILLIVIFIFVINSNKEVKEPASGQQKFSYYSFDVDGEGFLIGEEVSYYEKKGYSYKDNYYSKNDFIVSDGFMPHLFYKNNNPVMYAAMHCQKEDKCSYSEARIIKINFYDAIGKVTFADFITIGTTVEEVEEKLGKADGTIYTNDNEKVWSFYDKGKVGTPYYVLEFGSGKVVNMKIGVWWYEDEYEHTIKKWVSF
ncbi:MAG: hypothetical protein IJO43_02365 [Bacilli bacterium]|nr:hypothetical protein [Bacilli bacterium]